MCDKNPSKFQFPKGFLMEADKQTQKLTSGKKKNQSREILKKVLGEGGRESTLLTYSKAMIIKAV